MKRLRLLVSIFVLAFLVLGYGASQYAALNGTAAQYASAIDQSPISWLSLFILVLSIVFVFIRDKGANEP